MRDGGEEKKKHTGCFLHALSYRKHHGKRLFRNVLYCASTLAHRPWDKLQLPSTSADKENPPVRGWGWGRRGEVLGKYVASSVFPG